ncbi:MAG TPA: hypothetical protein VMW04_04415, partial [Patescibacteria group bacterium]|nr:hypothetical protein [Patescibacteria group bacterium]
MKQKLIILAVFIVIVGLVSLGKPSPSLATNWFCPSVDAYRCCYVYNQGRNCEASCGCVDYDNMPTCDVSEDCHCRTIGSECGSSDAEICHNASGGWLYQFNGRCNRPDRDPETGLCPGKWYYTYKECSAADRCEDSRVGNIEWACGGAGGTGSNTNGKILPGICSAGTCSEGCRNGGWYKTCCRIAGGAVTAGARLTGVSGSCSGGFCPNQGETCVRATGCDSSKCLDSDFYGCWYLRDCAGPTNTPAPTGQPTLQPPPPTPYIPPPGEAWIAVFVDKQIHTVGDLVPIQVCQKPNCCWQGDFYYDPVPVNVKSGPRGGTVCSTTGFKSEANCNSCATMDKKVNTGQDENCTWDTTGWPAGDYVLGVYTGGHSGQGYCDDGAASHSVSIRLIAPTPTPTCAPPAAPQCSSPNSPNDIVYETSVNLIWQGISDWGNWCGSNANDRKYEIYFGQNSPPPFLLEVPRSPTSYLKGGLEYNQSYVWGVKAKNLYKTSGFGNLCFFLVKMPDPWWQTTDGDVHAQGTITSLISACAMTAKYLSLNGVGVGGSPGVVTWGGGKAPTLEKGAISTTNWQANDLNRRPQVGFDYLTNRLNIDKSQEFSGTSLPGNNGIYYTKRSSFDLQGGEVGTNKIIIFAEGDVRITGITMTVDKDKGGFFALIAKGRITFDGAVTQAEGFYLADGVIDTSLAKSAFKGSGSFVAWGGFVFQRDLSNGTTGGCTPSE